MVTNRAPQPLTPVVLRRQNQTFRDSGGVSENNGSHGFMPAFLDLESGAVYLARFADGRPAPIHLFDGLPNELVLTRHESGAVTAVKPTVIAGFVHRDRFHRNRFYTREQTARAVRLVQRIRTRLQTKHP